MNKCGQCSLCCNLRGVRELRKRPFSPCPKCERSGCSEYAVRPRSCSEYQCLWLQLEQSGTHRLHPSLRPDKCGVVIEQIEGVEGYQLVVDPLRPNAWRSPKILRIVATMSDLGMPYIVLTSQMRVLLSNARVVPNADEAALLASWDAYESSSPIASHDEDRPYVGGCPADFKSAGADTAPEVAAGRPELPGATSEM